jgi:hypothetical protein
LPVRQENDVGGEERPERIAATVLLEEEHEDCERDRAANAVTRMLVEAPQRLQHRLDRHRRTSRLDLVRLLPSTPGRADEDDEQASEAAKREVRHSPGCGDEVEQVRDASHRRDQEVGEREQEAEEGPERTCGRRERREQRDRRHREGRPHRIVAGREPDRHQDEPDTGGDERHAP